jgi:hypothetical protein
VPGKHWKVFRETWKVFSWLLETALKISEENLSLCLINISVEDIRGIIRVTPCLTSALEGGDRPASCLINSVKSNLLI